MTWADFVVRGTLVLAAGFAASFVFGRASAAVRHFDLDGGFCGVLALPVALRLAPKVAVAALPAAARRGRARTVAAGWRPVRIGVDRVRGADRRGPDRRNPTGAPRLGSVLCRIADGGRAISGGRCPHDAHGARGAARGVCPGAGATRVPRTSRIGRPVRALESSAAAVPMTWGTLRPVVLLPEAARDWPAERLHAVVLHELIHVQRHDLLAQIAAQAACCLYWFHPMVWLAVRQLRKERETSLRRRGAFRWSGCS